MILGNPESGNFNNDETFTVHPESDEFNEPPDTKKELERDLHETQKSAYSKGTLKNLICQWRSFTRFSRKYDIYEWPVSEHTIALYAQFLAYTFHSPKSVRNYLFGIKTLHALMRVKVPNLKDIEVRLTMRGLEKIMNHAPKQASPISPEILSDMFLYLDMDKHEDRVFWGILLVGFWGMLRKSNLISDSKSLFDPLKQLTKNHVRFKKGIVILTATWAKNIQCRQKVLEIPLFQVPDSPLCPVNILRILTQSIKKGHYPLFGTGKWVTLTYRQFQKKLRTVLNKAGYKGKNFSSHSLRRGGATWAHRSGVPESLIQVHGGWQSDAYKRYLDFPIEIRAAVAIKMRQNIIHNGL